MKKSETMTKALAEMGGMISNNDSMAVAKTLDSVAKSLSAEIQAKKLKKQVINLADDDFNLGNLKIGNFEILE